MSFRCLPSQKFVIGDGLKCFEINSLRVGLGLALSRGMLPRSWCVALALTMSCGSTLISDKGLSKTCTVATDCAAVFIGDACSTCLCPNAAISTSSRAAYDLEVTQAQRLCGPRPAIACDCAQSTVECSSGTCTLKTQ